MLRTVLALTRVSVSKGPLLARFLMCGSPKLSVRARWLEEGARLLEA